jgi:hypothetical protein
MSTIANYGIGMLIALGIAVIWTVLLVFVRGLRLAQSVQNLEMQDSEIERNISDNTTAIHDRLDRMEEQLRLEIEAITAK